MVASFNLEKFFDLIELIVGRVFLDGCFMIIGRQGFSRIAMVTGKVNRLKSLLEQWHLFVSSCKSVTISVCIGFFVPAHFHLIISS